MLDRLTLDQLRVLVAVAETGSFSAAARKLGRVQSAVSQAAQTLEEVLGAALFDRYMGVINELDFGDPLRSALETSVLGGMAKLSFDTAGRITLPEHLCDMFGLTDWVVVVGLGERFQIWDREAFQAHRAAQRETAREGLAQLRAQQRAARAGAVA